MIRMHLQLSNLDIFVALALTLVSLRWNSMFSKDLIRNDFVDKLNSDSIITLLALFCFMYLATMRNVNRALIAFALFLSIYHLQRIELVYVVCAVVFLMVITNRATDTTHLKGKGGGGGGTGSSSRDYNIIF